MIAVDQLPRKPAAMACPDHRDRRELSALLTLIADETGFLKKGT
jgi:hypothetical protein